jgi:hypothetical protein
MRRPLASNPMKSLPHHPAITLDQRFRHGLRNDPDHKTSQETEGVGSTSES